MRELLRRIPQVSKVVESLKGLYPEVYIKMAAREVLDRFRREIAEGKRKSLEGLIEEVEERARQISEPNLKRVINATGVVINTNLGRAPLSEETLRFLSELAAGYSNLEFDLDSGSRGSRNEHVEELLTHLTGAQAALVLNNNAGAVLLVLNTLAKGKEVVISRGELVEIGGSFRIPEIMESSGAILKEVGTTNKTRLQDYERAINPDTAILMKVHRSNFYMEGFVQDTPLWELASLAKERGVISYYDSGSGLIADLNRAGLGTGEPTLRESLATGVDLVSCSGDKLLGSAQAGIVLGSSELIEKLKRNPLLRALRIDKLCLGALEYTLRIYMEGRQEEVPVIRMLTQPPAQIKRRAKRLLRKLKGIESLEAKLVKDFSKPGGGSMPHLSLETYCVALRHRGMSASLFSEKLRGAEPPVVCRIKEDTLLLDMRTVSDRELGELRRVLLSVAA